MRYLPKPSLVLATSLVSAICATGCNQETATQAAPPAPSPPAESVETATKPHEELKPVPGLVPLMTPQQVLGSLRIGRPDPFAPPPAPGLVATKKKRGEAEKINPIDAKSEFAGFYLTGIIGSASQAVAFVTRGESNEGTVRVGDIGGKTTTLLPSGWLLTRINNQNGEIILEKSGTTVTADF